MKNKGFSLVELIIVIAIMAILAAAIAPALIRYIDKSRRSDDVAAAESINTAAQAAFSNEDAYDAVQDVIKSGSSTNNKAGEAVYLLAKANAGATSWTAQNSCGQAFLDELMDNTGAKVPEFKYRKDGATGWAVGINSTNNKPAVFITGTFTGVTSSAGNNVPNLGLEIQPSIYAPYK